MADGKITERISGPFRRDEDFWRANIINSFLDFGYQPSEAEVAQLVPTSAGTGGYERGRSAVADYVRVQQAEVERQANDPLKEFIAEQEPKIGEYEKQAQDVYSKLKEVISGAPQLFGALSPEQIDQYLAPVRQAASQTISQVEGAFGRRGLAGSTVEAQSLAEQQRQFQENALSLGLTAGQQQQQLQAQAYQNQIAQLYGQAANVRGLVGGGAGQLSQQDLAQLQFLAGLPLLERGVAAQERAVAEAGKSKTDWGSIGSLAGMAGGALLAPFTGGASLPLLMGLGGSFGGAVGNIAGGNPAAAASQAGQIPWWLMMRPRSETPSTSLAPYGSINAARGAGNTLLPPTLSLGGY